MANNYQNLREKAAKVRRALFDEKYINEKQLVRMERFYAGSNPENVSGTFVEGIFKSFFEEGHQILHRMVHAMNSENVNMREIPEELVKLKNSSTCAGAIKVMALVDEMIDLCCNNGKERADELLTDLIGEYSVLKNKIIEYFNLLRLAGPADVAMPSQSSEGNKVEEAMPPHDLGTRREY